MSKYKTGDRFVFEIEEIEGSDGYYRIKRNDVLGIFNEDELDKLEKINNDIPEEYKNNIMKKFMEVR